MAQFGGSGFCLFPAGWLQAQALATSLHTWHLVNILCNSPPIGILGFQKYFPIFFIKENIAEGSSERDGILKECFGKHFWDSRREVSIQDCHA